MLLVDDVLELGALPLVAFMQLSLLAFVLKIGFDERALVESLHVAFGGQDAQILDSQVLEVLER